MSKATVKNKHTIQKAVQKQVSAAFRELFSDPDISMELSKYAENSLKRSLNSAKKGKTRSFSEVFKKYGV